MREAKESFVGHTSIALAEPLSQCIGEIRLGHAYCAMAKTALYVRLLNKETLLQALPLLASTAKNPENPLGATGSPLSKESQPPIHVHSTIQFLFQAS